MSSEFTAQQRRPLGPALCCGLAVCVALLAIGPGCTVCRHAKRTLLDEPAEYSARRDRPRSIKLYREWADQQWQQFAADDCGREVAGPEFEAGFRDGFVDYVYAGGTGEPPPLPPRKFWNAAHRNGTGHAGSAEWFNGYRVGAASARDGGYRRTAIVRSSYELSYGGALWDEPAYAPPVPQGEPIPLPPSEPAPLPNPQLNPPADPGQFDVDRSVSDDASWGEALAALGEELASDQTAAAATPTEPSGSAAELGGADVPEQSIRRAAASDEGPALQLLR